jgi:predicted dehydrogenase
MGEKRIQWGMIGCGNVTERKSAPSFNKIAGSRLVTVGSRTPARAEDYARRHGVARWHTDPFKVILDKEVDIVYIATPPGSHLEYALACIEAGKPVYIEKPMARNFQECQVINHAAESAGVAVYVAYYRRSLEYFRVVRSIIGDGRLGKVLQVHLQQHFPARKEDFDPLNPPWRVLPEISGGGYFHDMGCHALDILSHIFGDPLYISGTSANLGGLYGAADTITALLTLPGEVAVTASWSFVTPPAFYCDRVEVTGTEGKLLFPIFSFEPIQLNCNGAQERFTPAQPEHIQMPLIRTIVDELNGRGTCPSTGLTGAFTSMVMDRITGAFQNR